MADEILGSNGNLRFRLAPLSAFANPAWATVAELNSGQEVEGVYDLANYNALVQASGDQTWSPANSKSGVEARGEANYGGNVTFKHPGKAIDNQNLASLVWQLVRQPWTDLYAYWSVDGELGEANQPDLLNFADGDFYSIIKIVTDEWSDNITGEEDFDYTINLVKNGHITTYSVASTSTPVLAATVISGGTIVGSTGGLAVLGATVNGRDYWSAVDWSSDTPDVTVSKYGIVTVPPGTSAATVTITASLPDITPAVTDTVTITVS